MFGITPKRIRFFELFDELSAAVSEAAGKLGELLERFDRLKDRSDEIWELRRRGGRIALEAEKDLGGTFVTPLDREDIQGLISHLDGILSRVEAAADQISLFQIETRTVEARELAARIKESAELLAVAVPLLGTKNAPEILEHSGKVRKLAGEADRLQRRARAALFESRRDPAHLLKWNEIYDELEGAIDHSKCAAGVLETIVRKHA
jgi:hypothetical protein